MNKIITYLLIIPFMVFSQEKRSTKIGHISLNDLTTNVYLKDTTANAIVLKEHANVYLDEKKDYKFRTDYYYKIKIFNREAFNLANVTLNLYKKEKAINIKAITYTLENNAIKKTHLTEDKIFEKALDENWKEKRFTLPNIKEGCVIEYAYSIISPYSRLDNWYFQSDIPKIKSDYTTSIVGNYKYNMRMVGYLELDRKDISIKKNCIKIPGLDNGGCIQTTFGIDSIPAFKEEDYMLHKKNYLSRLIFDKISYTDTKGYTKKYTKTWKDVDKTIQQYFLDNQTTKKNYFKNNLPKEIITIPTTLLRAKKTYNYLQQNLTWNNKYWTQKKMNVKKTFEEKTGSVDALNLILYNSLQALDIESYIVALSTRGNGLPTKLYPITRDFNYIIVKAVIDNKDYFLDVTGKQLKFGQIPYKCINGQARILNFKEEGNWETIKVPQSNILTTFNLKLDETYNLTGNMTVECNGYFASDLRKKLYSKTEDDYLDYFESNNIALQVEKYSAENIYDTEKTLKQNFQVVIENNSTIANTITINPFFYKYFETNPFKLDERNYPVDFGYTRNYIYKLSIEIPEGYSLKELPENKMFSLPDNGGKFIVNYSQNNNKAINLFVNLKIDKQAYSNLEYHYLKYLFNKYFKAQEANIILEKTI